MTKQKDKISCAICGHSMFADTEDWENPLCNYHYEEILNNISKNNVHKENKR